MKHILLFSFLFFVSTFSYADQCPPNSLDTSFYKAFWKDTGEGKSPVSCIYSFIHGQPADDVKTTFNKYNKNAITRNSGWQWDSNKGGYVCMSKYQFNCLFG